MIPTRASNQWVPDCGPGSEEELQAASALLQDRQIAVLTGAGCSTESGIPDYRGPKTALKARSPVQYKQFIESASWRRRYWARAVTGWRRMAQAQPNRAHRAIAQLEAWGLCPGIITQNVDGLHHKAGSQNVLELHGSLHTVCCLDCRATEPRESLQSRLAKLNPGWSQHVAEMAPDGDAELELDFDQFQVADCKLCQGPLKPDVVFFGESVPRERVERAYQLVEKADALLVAGSSLTVFSGYRFVRRAAEQGKTFILLNAGPTRADSLATLKISAQVGSFLPALVELLEQDREA